PHVEGRIETFYEDAKRRNLSLPFGTTSRRRAYRNCAGRRVARKLPVRNRTSHRRAYRNLNRWTPALKEGCEPPNDKGRIETPASGVARRCSPVRNHLHAEGRIETPPSWSQSWPPSSELRHAEGRIETIDIGLSESPARSEKGVWKSPG